MNYNIESPIKDTSFFLSEDLLFPPTAGNDEFELQSDLTFPEGTFESNFEYRSPLSTPSLNMEEEYLWTVISPLPELKELPIPQKTVPKENCSNKKDLSLIMKEKPSVKVNPNSRRRKYNTYKFQIKDNVQNSKKLFSKFRKRVEKETSNSSKVHNFIASLKKSQDVLENSMASNYSRILNCLPQFRKSMASSKKRSLNSKIVGAKAERTISTLNSETMSINSWKSEEKTSQPDLDQNSDSQDFNS